MSASSDSPARWSKRGQRTIASTRIFELNAIRYHHPKRDTEREFFVLDAPNWVNVVAVTKDHQLVLVNQFRYGTDTFSLELPGGVIDAGEDPVESGLRELREETGYAGGHARLLGQVHANPAIQNNTCFFVLVEGVERTAVEKWDADEEIEMKMAPVDQVFAWAREGRILHSLSLGALFFFEGHWRAHQGKI